MQSTIVGIVSVIGVAIVAPIVGAESVEVVRYFTKPSKAISQPIECDQYKLDRERLGIEKDDILEKKCIDISKEKL